MHDAVRTGVIHEVLFEAGLAPSEHLVDAASVSAEQLVVATARHGIDLIRPTRSNHSWQRRNAEAIQVTDFTVDWERRSVRCLEGHESTSWGEYRDTANGRPFIRAGFSPGDCRPCTRTPSRQLTLHPRAEHEALAAARKQHESKQGRRLYAQPQGIEGTISQGVRSFGLRRARYRGLAKTNFQGVATAAALNLDRLAAWFGHRPLASALTSRFGAHAA